MRILDESGVDVDSVRLFLDNQLVAFQWEDRSILRSELSQLSEGLHVVRVQAADNVGNQGFAELRFRVYFPTRSISLVSEDLFSLNGEAEACLILVNPLSQAWDEVLTAKLDGVSVEAPVHVSPRGRGYVRVLFPVENLPPGEHRFEVWRQGQLVFSSSVRLFKKEELLPQWAWFVLAVPPVLVGWRLKRRERPAEKLAETV